MMVGRFRQLNLDALAYGSLLDELRCLSPLESVSFAWGSHFNRKREKRIGELPAVIGNWWRTAEGYVVLLAANLTDRPKTATYAVFDTGSTARLSLKPHEVKRIEGNSSGCPSCAKYVLECRPFRSDTL